MTFSMYPSKKPS